MIIPIEKLVIAKGRQREEIPQEHVDALAHSIATYSLLHAPTVEAEDDKFILRTGECRTRAIMQLALGLKSFYYGQELIPPGFIPVLLQNELSEEERIEVELRENIDRLELPWQDRIRAQEALHKLRGVQMEREGAVQTFKDTATEILGQPAAGSQITRVKENVLLAGMLNDPDIAKAKSESEARNIARRKTADVFRTALAGQFAAQKLSSPHSLIPGNCNTELPHFAARTFDVILTDPPYGIEADKMGTMSKSDSGLNHAYVDTLQKAEEVWISIFSEGHRITKDDAHLYMFLDFRHWERLCTIATTCGWTVWPTPLVWYKTGGGFIGDYLHGPRKSYELILFARKGEKTVTGTFPDVIPIPGIVGNKLHAAQKPVELYVNLLKRSVVPGDRVIDPCAGSGTIFPAANATQCVATGIEEVEESFNIALTRLGE